MYDRRGERPFPRMEFNLSGIKRFHYRQRRYSRSRSPRALRDSGFRLIISLDRKAIRCRTGGSRSSIGAPRDLDFHPIYRVYPSRIAIRGALHIVNTDRAITRASQLARVAYGRKKNKFSRYRRDDADISRGRAASRLLLDAARLSAIDANARRTSSAHASSVDISLAR